MLSNSCPHSFTIGDFSVEKSFIVPSLVSFSLGFSLHYLISGCTAYNLGTGQGTSVLEMVAAFEKASGQVIIILGSQFISSPSPDPPFLSLLAN